MSTRSKKAVVKKEKPNFAQMVRDILKNSADAMTKQEILSRIEWDNTGSTVSIPEKLGNAIRDQLRNGFAESETDTLGVIRYKLTGVQPDPNKFHPPKKPKSEWAKTGPKPKGGKPKSLIRAEERIAKKEEADSKKAPEQYSDVDRIKQELGVKQMDVQYETGYNRGYHDAMFHGHREAYNAGRQSVLKGLLKLLNIKGEVML